MTTGTHHPPREGATPRVSVIIPTYKHRDYVVATLDSVNAQAFRDYEVIVVNDGSPDDTSEILRPYVASRKIRYFEQSNGGQATARNRGIAEARGEFIALLDDDDLWPPDKLQWQVSQLERSPEAVVVYGYPRLFGAGPDFDEINPNAPSGWVRDAFVRGNWIRSPGQTLVRRSAIDKAGGLDPTIWGCDDWDLWLRLSSLGTFAYDARCSLWYRQHACNASRDVKRMVDNAMSVLHKHLGRRPTSTNRGDWMACRAFIHRGVWFGALESMRTASAKDDYLESLRMWFLAQRFGARGKGTRDLLCCLWHSFASRFHHR